MEEDNEIEPEICRMAGLRLPYGFLEETVDGLLEKAGVARRRVV